MRRLSSSVRFGLGILLVMVVAAILASQYLLPLRDAKGFLVPTSQEAAAARRQFALALRGDTAAAPVGLQARPNANWRTLQESEGDCRGRGTYLLRNQSAAPLAIVAPHRGSDRWTGTLAAALFDEGVGLAAAWNSAPRRGKGECPGGDPTRLETHYLTAFSLAFADVHSGGRIVQLHGFDGARRRSRAARLADIIISEGTDTPNEALYDFADCLSRELHPLRVRVFPGDVAELGALNNRQGQAVRAAGFTGFAHIEMARSVRRRLVEDAPLRRRFAACLTDGLA